MRYVSVILLFFCAVAFSCSSDDEVGLEDIEKIPLPAASTFLALGDSYTFAQGIPEAGRWPVHLSSLLSKEGIEVGMPLVIARTGWTTSDLLQYLRTVSLANDYGLVSLQIGVNNQYQGQSLTTFRTEFAMLLSRSVAFAKGDPKRVVVLTIPDWGVTPFANGQSRQQISAQIQSFNQVISEEAAKAGIAVVDVYDLSLQVTQTPSLLAPDGLHYSSQMYLQWAQRVLPQAKSILRP